MTPNELWTIGIAGYAAVISTFVLGWDAYKWLHSGPKVRLLASTGMKMVGGGPVGPKHLHLGNRSQLRGSGDNYNQPRLPILRFMVRRYVPTQQAGKDIHHHVAIAGSSIAVSV